MRLEWHLQKPLCSDPIIRGTRVPQELIPHPTSLSLSQCPEVVLLELRDSISPRLLHMWSCGPAVDNWRSAFLTGTTYLKCLLCNLPVLAFFPCCCKKRTQQSNQREKEAILALDLRWQTSQSSRAWNCWSHHTTVQKQRVMNTWYWPVSSRSLFVQSRVPIRDSDTHSRQVFPFQWAQLRYFPTGFCPSTLP